MAVTTAVLRQNRLLTSLSESLQAKLCLLLELVALPLKQILYEPRATVHAVYFPLTACISLLLAAGGWHRGRSVVRRP